MGSPSGVIAERLRLAVMTSDFCSLVARWLLVGLAGLVAASCCRVLLPSGGLAGCCFWRFWGSLAACFGSAGGLPVGSVLRAPSGSMGLFFAAIITQFVCGYNLPYRRYRAARRDARCERRAAVRAYIYQASDIICYCVTCNRPALLARSLRRCTAHLRSA